MTSQTDTDYERGEALFELCREFMAQEGVGSPDDAVNADPAACLAFVASVAELLTVYR